MKLSLRLLFSSLDNEIENLIHKNSNIIPFHINRTLSDNLAVFVKFRNNGTIAFTHVRKVKGNRFILKEQLRQIVGRTPINVTNDCFIIQGQSGFNYKYLVEMIKSNINFKIEVTDGLYITSAIFFSTFIMMLICWVSYGSTISDFYKNHVSHEFNFETKLQK